MTEPELREWWERAVGSVTAASDLFAGLTPNERVAVAALVLVLVVVCRSRWVRRRLRRARRRAIRRLWRWLGRSLRSLFTFRRRRPVSPAPVGVEPGGPAVLYRHYDADDRLLYVGITDARRGGQRWHEHADDKPWFHLVARSEVSHPYPTRADALYAEAVAIRDEGPVYNICRPDPARVGRA